MRFLVAMGVAFGIVPPALAFDSPWLSFEAYAILAPHCPAEVKSALKGLPVGDLKDAIAIARQREVEITARVKTGGDLAAADRAITDYRRSVVAQIEAGLKGSGCAGVVAALGMALPRPATRDELAAAARTVPIPSTARIDGIPAADRIGTSAAHDLQGIVVATITKGKACDLTSLKVSAIKVTPVEGVAQPPFVGVLQAHEERWDVICDGRRTTSLVSFRQDARRWRSYKISQAEPGKVELGMRPSLGN